MRLILAVLLLSSTFAHAYCDTCQRDAHGRIARSLDAKKEFKRNNPCPANGLRFGRCPGYVIDHKIALACNGADNESNMQWQTKEEAKAKDVWERRGC